MPGVWLGLDVGAGADAAEVEHRALAAVADLGLDVDHVVMHAPSGHGVARAVAAVRVRAAALPAPGATSPDPEPRAAEPASAPAVPPASAPAATLAASLAVSLAASLADRMAGTAAALADGGDPVLAGDPGAAALCVATAEAARDGVAGRCVRFPGQDRLTGLVPVRRIVERSAIARVAGSGWPVSDDDVVDTRGFLRPRFEGGHLVLRVGPAAGGLLVPDETAEPHACCAGGPG